MLVASNEAKTDYEFKVLGDNIFAGILRYHKFPYTILLEFFYKVIVLNSF